MYKLYNDDCLKVMPKLADKSIDLILCDLPYGVTDNDWDKIIPFKDLWYQYERLITDRGCIALFAQPPFDKVLAASNLPLFKYEWVWYKTVATKFLNAHYAPLRNHELILIFSKAPATYVKDNDNKTMLYFPQFIDGEKYVNKRNSFSSNYRCSKSTVTTSNDGRRYPKDVLTFASDKDGFHPTQKPVALCEYLVKTYTLEGMTVLDNCMGSGTTGVAAYSLNRNFIGIELNPEYYAIAERRIKKANGNLQLDLSSLL